MSGVRKRRVSQCYLSIYLLHIRYRIRERRLYIRYRIWERRLFFASGVAVRIFALWIRQRTLWIRSGYPLAALTSEYPLYEYASEHYGSGSGSDPVLDWIRFRIGSGSESDPVLNRIRFWIGSGSGSDSVLDRIRFWIGSGSGSDPVLDRIRFWIGSSSGSDPVLDRIRFWIGSGSGSEEVPVLDPVPGSIWQMLHIKHSQSLKNIFYVTQR